MCEHSGKERQIKNVLRIRINRRIRVERVIVKAFAAQYGKVPSGAIPAGDPLEDPYHA